MKHFCVACYMFAGVSASASAMGLADAYSLALQKDPKLKAASLSYEASKFELDKAQAGYLPRVQLSLSRGRGSTDAETGSALSSGNRVYDTKNYGLTLKQPLLNFGLSPQKGQAVENIAISELQMQGEAQNLFSRVCEKYFSVLYTTDVLQTQQNKLSSLERQRIQAVKRFRAGVSVKNDVSDLDAELALAKAQILESELQLSIVKKQFEVLVGQPAEALSGLDYQTLKAAGFNSRSLEEWLAIARENNPELMQAMKQIQVSSYEFEKNKALHYPTLDLLISRTKTESDTNITIGSKFDTLSGVLQLNVPIYAGGYVSAAAQQSAILIDAAKETHAAKYTQVLEKIASEYNNLHDAMHLMQAYDTAIGFYESSFQGANKAYAAGTRTLSDVLKIRDRLTDTQLSLSKTCYNYMLSYIHLRELTGEANQEDLAALDAMLKSNAFALRHDSLAKLLESDELE